MKILLVDDDIHSRQSLASFLISLNHEIVECSDGKSALEILRTGNFQLVLSDIKMPNLDGNELLKTIKSSDRYKNIIVVLMTGFGDVRNAVEAMRIGAYDYLLKPINVEELATIIERIGEYLSLKDENRRLTEEFNESVSQATSDVKNELDALKKAYARDIGLGLVGVFSEPMKKVFETADRLHEKPEIPVLIEGETGTGKEVIAKVIHYGEEICSESFIGLNCAAISPTLFESELFGYEPGAFTGGNPKGQKGKIELAKNGTVFLDEIAELSNEFQAKLLRILQEREYYRIGGLKKLITKARFICATNKNIKTGLKDGTFREDLYYRLNVGYIRIPPLRERKEEIMPFAEMFLKDLNARGKTGFKKIHKDAEALLQKHTWPGNVRELRNIIERIILFWDGKEILSDHIKAVFDDNFRVHPAEKKEPEEKTITEDLTEFPLPEKGIDLNELVLDIVARALQKHNGNKTDAAKFLGISRNVLYTYLKKLD